MWLNIIENLKIIGWVFAIFITIYIVNILFSIGENVLKLKNNFDKNKFKCGIIKMLIIGIGSGLLSISFTMITYFIDYTADIMTLEISNDLLSICNVGVIVAVYFKSIKKYLSECWETLQALLDNLKEFFDII